MAKEWIISDDQTVGSFGELDKIYWKQSTKDEADDVAVGDIVYIFSNNLQSVKFKCKVNTVNLPKADIDDKKFNISGEFDDTFDSYMELELVKELKGDLYSKAALENHGFLLSQNPINVTFQVKEYLNLVQKLQEAHELDPDIHDGSYEMVRETINAYANMDDLSSIDYKDLNLVYLMSIGTWKHGIGAKKDTIVASHLPQIEKNRLSDVLDKVWSKAENYEYQNEEKGKPSIGMFGTGFFSFYGKTDAYSPRNFIQMCIDIKDMTDERVMLEHCSETLINEFHGMGAASASMVLHCLKPTTFPIFNSNMGIGNIFEYLLGEKMKGNKEIDSYIKNVGLVKKLRDDNFSVKNYRIFDMAARDINFMNEDLESNVVIDVREQGERGKEAFEKHNNGFQYDKNMILYGPPGTGKTYNTAIYAVAICDQMSITEVENMGYDKVLERYRELKDKEKRIAFTTFHQSYGYEEFIEGIKPKMDSGSKDIEYTIKDGVFKAFCNRAGQKKAETADVTVREDARVWNIILGGNVHPDLKQKCFDEGTIRIGWDEWPEVITEETENLNDKQRRILLNFQDEMEIGDIVVTRSTPSAVDGVGIVCSDSEVDDAVEGYFRKRKVEWIHKGEDIEIIDLNGGTRLDRKSVYELRRINASDILSRIPDNSKVEMEDETRPYVFIIDEINRGNISKIFGELITLIEPTKRKGASEGMEVILPYSNKPFGVPNNVYIIGTMNTADRSIALMDTALRRRFQFIEKMPDVKVLRKIGADKINEEGIELDVAVMLETINERIEYLFDREHTIGHAFFTGLKDEPTVAKLADIFKKSVIPLLQEYFYEDYSKIMLVLGDNGKKLDERKFILATETNANTIFRGDTSDIDIPDFIYKIQESAFNDIWSYIEITD